MRVKKSYTDKEAMQQILVNAACGKLREEGATEFDCSLSESSDTEPQGKEEWTKKEGSNKEEPKTKAKSDQAGSSRGTSKTRSLSNRHEENKNSGRVTKSNDQPPPKRFRRGLFSRQ